MVGDNKITVNQLINVTSPISDVFSEKVIIKNAAVKLKPKLVRDRLLGGLLYKNIVGVCLYFFLMALVVK